MAGAGEMKTTTRRIREGFPGQRLVVLPRRIVASWLSGSPLVDFMPSDVGHFPSARWHFVERKKPISQAIIIYCVEGEGWGRIGGGSTFPIRSGHIALFPTGSVHAYGASADMPWSIFWVHVSGIKAEILPALLELEPDDPVLFVGKDPALASLFERILSILGRGYSADNLLLSSMALGELISHLVVNRHRHPNNDTGIDERIERVIDRMHNSLGETLSIEELAGDANLSCSHFAAIFKKRTGFPVLDFFTRLKMQQACYLLDSTAMPIKTIAADLGFEDPFYFSRTFRRIYDLSPLQYRTMRKG